MRRLLIFSDSLALPRSTPEITWYEDTYPCLLKDNFEVFQCSKGGGLMGDFVEQVFYYRQFRPDVVLLQIGIVDCAPRAFSKMEEYIFKSNRFLYKIRYFLSKYKITKRIRKVRQLSWTSPDKFRKGCEFFIQKFSSPVSVYALSIVPVTHSYEIQVPGIKEKVNKYNKILKDVFGENFIDLDSIPFEGIMADHHHLTKIGHQYVYHKVLDYLK